MTTARPGEIWIAEIPYTDGSGAKKRPVLVLWLDGTDAVVVAITSALPRGPTDVVLTDWSTSGLRLPSTARLSRLDCLEVSLLVHRLGTISTTDADLLRDTWSALVRPQF
jgi:mRNA interferase MazF